MISVETVYANVLATLGPKSVAAMGGEDKVKELVRKTIAECGLFISERTGEVYDPAPKPTTVFSGVRPRTDTNVRYGGGGRRRKGYRR